MEAIDSDITQVELDKMFMEYENLKLQMVFENTKENKIKFEQIKKKLIEVLGEEFE